MTDDIARLGIAVDSRPVRSASDDLKKFTQEGGNAEGKTKDLGKQFRSTSTDAGQFASTLRSLVGPLATFLSAREIAQSSEQWTTLSNRLRLVTSSTTEFVDAQAAVFRIAQESRQPLESSAELYQRIATNADQLKLSGTGVAAVVDTISKTLAISGTSGASASAALTQLGQAFASGTLRGEELNSVLEQAPALAKTLADGLGVTVGELRSLGQEGALTADAVVQAILSQSEAVNEQFGQIQSTGSQALTVLGNSFTRVVGELNDATGASSLFAGTIISIADYFDSGAFTNGVIKTFDIWGQTIDSVTSSAGDLSNELQFLSDVGGDSAGFIVKAFQELPANIKSLIEILVVEVASGFDEIQAYAVSFRDGIKAVFTDDTLEAVGQRLEASINNADQARQSSIETILRERDAILSNADAEIKRREEERKTREERQAAATSQFASTITPGAIVGIPAANDDNLEKALERVKDQLATEEEAIVNSFVKRQEILAEYLQANSEFQDQYNELSLANVTAYNDAVYALDKKRLDDQVKLEQDAAKKVASEEKKQQQERLTAQRVYAQLASSIIYAAFGESKDARRAQALISTYTGAANAYAEVPYPYNFAAAAAVTIAGLKQVSLIDKTTIGSGGGSSSVESAPGTIGQTSFNTPAIAQPVTQQETRPQVIIEFSGPVTGLTEEILAEKINELIERDYINIAS